MNSRGINKFFVLLFAAVIFISASGIYFFGSINTALQRRANMKRQHREESVTLSLSKSEFNSIHWVGEKDFMYNGKLYDIEKFSVEGGRYVVTCEHDEYESGLFSLMKNQLDAEHNSGGEKQAKTSGFTFDYILPEQNPDLPVAPSFIEYAEHHPAFSFSPFIPSASPPPEA